MILPWISVADGCGDDNDDWQRQRLARSISPPPQFSLSILIPPHCFVQGGSINCMYYRCSSAQGRHSTQTTWVQSRSDQNLDTDPDPDQNQEQDLDLEAPEIQLKMSKMTSRPPRTMKNDKADEADENDENDKNDEISKKWRRRQYARLDWQDFGR